MSNIEFNETTLVPGPTQPQWKDEEYFNVLMPTYSGNAPVDTMELLEDFLNELKVPYRWIEAARITGVATAKTVMFEMARHQTHLNFIRGLIIEDDIVIPRGALPDLLKHVRYAMENKLNIVTNIWVPGIGWSVFHKIVEPDGKIKMQPYSDKELTEMPQYGHVDSSGIGFYYGDIPLDYVWHDGTCKHCTRPECRVGQDFAFFNDCGIELSFVKFPMEYRFKHRKVVDL